MERNKTIDIAKGCGLIFVVLGHLVTYGSALSRVIFTFHMPLFFFLSGYCFKTDYSIGSFKHKQLSLVLPYIFFSVLSVTICCIVPSWRNFNIKDIFIEYIYNANPNMFHIGQIWFFIALADIVCLMWFCNFFIKTKIGTLLFALLCFLIAYIIRKYSIGIMYNGEKLRIPLKLDDALAGFVFYSTGCVVRDYEVIDKFKRSSITVKIGLLSLVTSLMVLTILLNGMVNIDTNFNNPILYLIGSFSGICATLFFSSMITNTPISVLSWIGKNSLTLFSIHSYFIILWCLLLSVVFKMNFVMMRNLTTAQSVIGAIFVVVCCAPFAIVYNKSVNIMIRKMSY